MPSPVVKARVEPKPSGWNRKVFEVDMIRKLRGIGTGMVFALLFGGAVSALAGVKDVRKQIEASMLVTGSIIIEPDGAVGKLDLDQREKLPEAVVGLVEKAAAEWKFEPVLVDGTARRGKARMSLRVVANKLPNGDYQLALTGGYFGDDAITPEERQQRADSVRGVKLRPPMFPEDAARMGARGMVYLVVKVERDGSVGDVLAEQVNLEIVGDERQMQLMRRLLSKAALIAARKWTFQPPSEGASVDAPYWLVRVPVDYRFHGDKTPGYGEWQVYIPGPRESAPWMQSERDDGGAPDAMVAGGVYEIGKGRRLLTPLSG